jgi:hypothetical protein
MALAANLKSSLPVEEIVNDEVVEVSQVIAA